MERESDEDRTEALKLALETIWKKLDPNLHHIKKLSLTKQEFEAALNRKRYGNKQ